MGNKSSSNNSSQAEQPKNQPENQPENQKIKTPTLYEFKVSWSRSIIKYTEIQLPSLPESLPKDISHDTLYLIDSNYVNAELFELFEKLGKLNCAFILSFSISYRRNTPMISTYKVYHFYPRWFLESVIKCGDEYNFSKVLISIPNINIIEQKITELPDNYFDEYDNAIENIIKKSLNKILTIKKLVLLHQSDKNISSDIWENKLKEKINIILSRKYKCYELTYKGSFQSAHPIWDIISYSGINSWSDSGVVYIWLTADQYNRFPDVCQNKEKLDDVLCQKLKKNREQFFMTLQFDPVKPVEEGQV